MKKIFLAFIMPFLACTAGFSQEEVQPEPVKAQGLTTYWVDSTANNKRLLNKSKFGDNWFIGIHAGGRYSWGTNVGGASVLEQIQPSVALSVGKWLAPAGGLRIQGFFGGNSGRDISQRLYHFKSVGVAIDGLFNFTNLFCGYEEDRVFNLIGFLGAGYEHSGWFSDRSWNTSDYRNSGSGYKTKGSNLISARVGLIANFRLSDAWSFNVEASNSWLDDSYDGRDAACSLHKWDGHIDLLLGLTYRFRNHDGSHQFTWATRDMSKYDALNDEINRIREENDRLAKQYAEAPVETRVIEQNRVRTYISFDNNSSEINKLQEVNVYTAAEGMKKFEGCDLYITPSGSVSNTDLFVARAQSVRNVLVNTYNIPAGRIFVEKNPALIQSLDPQKNCVIVYVNE